MAYWPLVQCQFARLRCQTRKSSVHYGRLASDQRVEQHQAVPWSCSMRPTRKIGSSMPLPPMPMNRVNPRTNTTTGSCAFSVETGFSPSSWSRRPVLHGSHELPNSLFDVPRIDLLDRGAFEAILARRREGGKRLFALNADGRLDTTSLDMDSPPPSDNPEHRALENTSDRQCARDQQSYPHQRDRPAIRHTGDGRPSHLSLR